jgi:hypothetical protein
MKINFNPFRKALLPVLLIVLLSSLKLVSCDKDELEVQNDFPFEVTVMPVPKDIVNRETVEIRITIKRSGNYSDTKYFIRYFQFDGQGTLKYYNDPPYLTNDLYELPENQFRLCYTSHSTVSQSFDVWISDNFGNEKQLTFQFNSRN